MQPGLEVVRADDDEDNVLDYAEDEEDAWDVPGERA